MSDLLIVKGTVKTSYIEADGNVHQKSDEEKFFLVDRDRKAMSHQYYCMSPLGWDHYAVCDLVSDVQFWSDYNEYDIFGEQYKATVPKFKWGIIRVNRDESGKVIPKGETMVVPYMYNRISSNNLKTATVYHNGRLSYLDLNVEKGANYCKQLVPCKLEHAVPFGVMIGEFAECSLDGVIGYLPRNCGVRENLRGEELLSENEAIYIAKKLSGQTDLPENFVAEMKYFNLTGEKFVHERRMHFTKKDGPQG